MREPLVHRHCDPCVGQENLRLGYGWILFRLALALFGGGVIPACNNGGRTALQLTQATNYTTTVSGVVDGQDFNPGEMTKEKIKFVIKTKDGAPVQGIAVDFKVFDITSLETAQLDSTAVAVRLRENWETTNPTFYSDQTTKPCSEKTSCSEGDTANETERAASLSKTSWLGSLSGASSASDRDGAVSVSYQASVLFERTMAVAIRPISGQISDDFVQFVRVKTTSLTEFLKNPVGSGGPIQPTIVTIPAKVLAGKQFSIAIQANIPDTGAKSIAFDVTTSAVVEGETDLAKPNLPQGRIACVFRNGQCIIPGGPFRVSATGYFKISLKPDSAVQAIAPVLSQIVPVSRGSASKLVVSSTPPDRKVTPFCQDVLSSTTNCAIWSVDQAKILLYPALIDDGGNFVGLAETNWSATGPAASLIASGAVGAELELLPVKAGSGVFTVVASGTETPLTFAFPYVLNPGLPASLTISNEQGSGVVSQEAATVPFKAIVRLYDANKNLCTNYNAIMNLAFSAENAQPSVPPVGSGWAPMSPAVTFTEAVTFNGGIGTTINKFTFARALNAGDTRPVLTVTSDVLGKSSSSTGITVTAGPATRALFRTSPGNNGSLWTQDTNIRSDMNYYFHVAGYDAAGNYVSDLSSAFYGVKENFDASLDLSNALTINPSDYALGSRCPVLPEPQPQPLSCAIHRSLSGYDGTSVIFATTAGSGSGRIMAVPVAKDASGNSLVSPIVSPVLSIAAGAAASLSIELFDPQTGNPIPRDPTSGNTEVQAGQEFTITVHALDAKGIYASEYAGAKSLKFISTAKPSWGGWTPRLPSGTISCEFSAGSCSLPGTFAVYDDQVVAAVSVQDISPPPANPIPKVWSLLISANPGGPAHTVVATRKGGPAEGAEPFVAVLGASASSEESTLGPMVLSADQELPLAGVVTDLYGNWLRDLTEAEAIWDGTADITTQAVPNATNTWTSSDIFAALGGLNQSSTAKFLPVNSAQILSGGNKDPLKYGIVYQPADRVGSGWILVKSSAMPSLVARPSRAVKIIPGNPEHVEIVDKDDQNNINQYPGECFSPRIRIHDKKHNIITQYTTTTQMAVKWFKPGVIDANQGNFTYLNALRQASYDSRSVYRAGNSGPYPTLNRAGFVFPLSAGSDPLSGGGPAMSSNISMPYFFPAPGPTGNKSYPVGTFYEDWWIGSVGVLAGEVSFPGKLCLWDARQDATSNNAVRELQVELPSVTVIDGSQVTMIPPLVSRGAGTLGSTATAHSQPDRFTTRLGGLDHVHFTLVDNEANPNWIPRGYFDNKISWIVDEHCPLHPLTPGRYKSAPRNIFTNALPEWGFCGGKTIYVHKHDSGCNFLGASSPTNASLTGLPATMAPPGPLGSAAFVVAPQDVTPGHEQIPRGGWPLEFSNSEKSQYPAVSYDGLSSHVGGGFEVYSGAPVAARLGYYYRDKSIAGLGFKLVFQLLDRFGNVAGNQMNRETPLGFYESPQRRLTLSWDAKASPKGTPSVIDPSTIDLNSMDQFNGALIETNPIHRANEPVTINATITDIQPRAACNVGPSQPCPPPKQTFSASVTLTPEPSVPVKLEILDDPSLLGKSITENKQLMSGQNLELALCAKDAEGNIVTCDIPSASWEVVESQPADPADTVLSLSVSNDTVATATGRKVAVNAIKTGTAKIRASTTYPITGTVETGRFEVPSGRAASFSFAWQASPIVAGTPITVEVMARDVKGNVATAFNGVKTVNMGALNDINAVTHCYGYSSARPNGSTALTFTNGRASFNATVFIAGNNGYAFTINYPGGADTYLGQPIVSLSSPLVVQPASLNSYFASMSRTASIGGKLAVQAKATPDNDYGETNANGSRFDVTIRGIDPYGNVLDLSQPGMARTVSIRMVDSDGAATTGQLRCQDNTTSCLANILVNSAAGTTVPKLAFDQGLARGGMIYTTDGVVSARAGGCENTVVNFISSRQTVASYAFSRVSSGFYAGTEYSLEVIARDNSGQPVLAADSDLSAMDFTWTDGLGGILPNSPAPSNVPPVLPSRLTFSNGVAIAPFRLFYATLSQTLRLEDNQSPPKSATSSPFWVTPAWVTHYRLSATSYPGGTPLANGTTLNADCSNGGLFTLKVAAVDFYSNPKIGEGNLQLKAVPEGGLMAPAALQKTGLPFDSSARPYQYNVLAMTTSERVFSGICYTVPHRVKFTLGNSAGTILAEPVLEFVPTIDTIDHYDVQLSSYNFAAGAPVTATIQAKDWGDNTILGLDSILNSQTYTWTGAGISPAPYSKGLLLGVAGAPAGLFSNGTAQTTLTFYRAEAIANAGFRLLDNRSMTYNNAQPRAGASEAITVNSDLPMTYVLSAPSLVPSMQSGVGVPFPVQISVIDAHGNPSNEWTSDTLTWTWSNAAASAVNPANAVVSSPSVPTNGTTTFSGASASPGNAVVYRTSSTPSVLTVSGSRSGTGVTQSGAALTGSLSVSPVAKADVAYIYLTNGGLCGGNGDCGNKSTRQTDPITLSTANTKLFYAHGFDLYGNYKGTSAASFSLSNASVGSLTSSEPGTTTFTALSAGSTTVTGSCTHLGAGCIGDTTGTISVASGGMVFQVSHSTTVVAGTPFTVTITAKDGLGNIAQDYTGTKSINITLANDMCSPEWTCSSFPQGWQSLPFSSGVATFSATLYAASSGYQFQVFSSGPPSVFGNGPLFAVNSEALHHFVTTVQRTFTSNRVPAKSIPDNQYADSFASDGYRGSRFNTQIEARDQYGNTVNMSGANSRTLTISLRKFDDLTNSTLPLKCLDNSQSCLTNVVLNAADGRKTISGLAYDLQGDYYIWAVDQNGITTLADENFSHVVNFYPSRATVASYSVAMPASGTAGSAFVATVTALDNSGTRITGADMNLGGLTFSWFDGSGNAIPASPGPASQAPTLPAKLTFSGGTAYPSLTLFKAPQSLQLRIRDDQSSPRVGTSATSINVGVDSSFRYRISAFAYPSGTALADYSLVPADGSDSGRLRLTVSAYDSYDNPKAGEGGVALIPIRMSGTLNISYLAGSGRSILWNSVSSGPLLNLTTGTDTLDNMYYTVGQTVRFGLNNSAGQVVQTPILAFQNTIHTVDYYSINLASNSPIAGTPISVTIRAKDAANNTVIGIDGDLNAQNYTWSGPGISPSPANAGLTLGADGAPANQFASGVATTTLTFGKAEALSSGSLMMTDNHNTTYRGGRAGTNDSSITVGAGAAKRYVLTSSSTSPMVGQPIAFTLSALDNNSNPVTGWTQDNLSWQWIGASSSVSNPYTSSVYNPTLPPDGSTSFSNGTVNMSYYSLFRSGETATLKVTGSTTANTVGGVPLTATLNFTPQISPDWGYVYITNSAVCNGVGDCGAGSTRQTGASSIAIGNNVIYYAHGFDPYGNYKGAANVTWSASGTANVSLSPLTSASSSTLSPQSTGNAVVQASCASLKANCISDATGTISVSVGSRYFAISYPTTAIAGSPFTVTVTAKDANGNVDPTYTGSQSVTISAQNVTNTAEGYSVGYPSGSQNLVFSSGVATFQATAYNAANTGLYFQVSQAVPQLIFGTGPVITSVAPLALHHYATVALRTTGNPRTVPAKSVLDSNYADQMTNGVAGSRFDLRIFARDQYGNNVDMSAAPRTLTMTLRKSDGTTASALPLKCADNTQNCLSGITLGSTSGNVIVYGLAYDVGGTHYVWVSDPNGVVTTASASTPILFSTSRLTVNNYRLTVPTNATAGTPFAATVAAIDNAGSTITGADSDLGAMAFTWTDAGGGNVVTDHMAPDGITAPTIPATSLPFSSGSASLLLTLVKAEALGLTLTDNQTTPKSGSSSGPVTVGYSSALRYRIESSLGASASNVAADPTGTFNLTITAFDPYLNPRPGESSAILKVNRISGASTTHNLEGTGLTVSSGGVVFNALSGSATINNAYYRVAQSVTFDVAGSSGSVIASPTHTFVSSIGSVASYRVTHAASAQAGPTNLPITVTALDPAGNTVVRAAVDTALGGQTYTWTGANSSPSGTGMTSPSFPTTGYTFSNGVASITASLYNAASTTLTVKDNNSLYALGQRSGTSTAAASITNRLVSKYAISATTNPQAGAAFNVTVRALDQYNNAAVDWTTDTLTFSWASGASSSVTNPKNASVFNSSVASGGSQTFTNGQFITTGTPFVLYRAGEVSSLSVVGTSTNTSSGSALSTTLSFTPVANATTGYILMTDSLLCTNGLGTTCSGSNVLNGASFAMTTDIARNLYAHGFDPFGNYKALTSVTWSGTNELGGKMTPSSGSQTSLAATTVTATNGTVTADCSLLSGCISATTGAITVNYGSINKIVFTSSAFSGATTDSCSTVTVQVQDYSNNAVNVAAPVNVTFSNLNSNPATNDGVFYTTNACTTPLSSSQGTIAAGSNSVTVYFKKATVASATTIRAAYSTYVADQVNVISIGTLKKIAITTSPLTQTAVSGCGTVSFNVTDNSGNIGTLSATSTVFTLSSTGTQGAFHSDSACTSVLASSQISLASQSGATVYYKDLRAGTPTLTVAATLAGGAATISQSGQTINPGVFDFTSPTSGTSVKDTQTVSWSASAGAKDYVVTYGNGSCGGTPATVNAPTTSWAIPTSQNIANYRVCVTARGWDSSLPTLVATSNATYSVLIDNTKPTQTITAPASGVTMIGPVTTATGANTGTTTFAGTASDAAPSSGVQTVQVSLKNNSTNTFWNGTSWVASTTWNNATGTSSWTYNIANNKFISGTTYTLSVQTIDGSGNVSNATSIASLTWNSSPPASVTLSGAPGTFTNQTVLNVTVGGTNVVRYQFALVTGASCGTPTYSASTVVATKITTALSSDVQYTLCVLGVDQAENVQTSPTSVTFTRDRVNPTVSVGSPSTISTNGSYNLAVATTAPSASDALAGVASYAWTVGTPTTTNCAASNLTFSNNAILAPTISVSAANSCTYGSFPVTLTVMDTAGNSATSSLTFNYDTRSPTVTAIAGTAGFYKAGATINITLTFSKTVVVSGTPQLALNTTPAQNASYVSGSNSTQLVFSYTVAAGDNTTSSPTLYATDPNVPLNISSSSALSLNSGTITDTVGLNLGATNTRAANAASLTGLPTSGSSSLINTTLVVDTYAPTDQTSQYVAAVLPTAESKSLAPSIQLQSKDVASFKWCVVAGNSCPALGSCTNNVSYGGTPQSFTLSSISGFAEGQVTVCTYATDRAGNVQSSPTAFTWIKDTVAPQAFTVNGPTSPTYTSTPIVTWTTPATDITNITLKIGTDTTCSAPSQTYGTIPGTSTSYTLSTLPDGTYFACMTAADFAGNTTTMTAYAFEVETSTVHAAFTSYDGVTTYGINYAQRASGSWTTETVKSVTTGTLDPRTSLALDSNNYPYVTYRYQNATNATLYANSRSGTWGSDMTLLNHASATVGKFASLALDSSNLFWTSMQNIISGKDSIYLTQWDNSPSCYTSCTPTTAGQNRDTSLASTSYVADTDVALASSSSGNDVAHYVYSYYNGTNWKLRYRQSISSASNYEEIPLAASCTDAEYAQVFVKPTGTANQDRLAMVYACVTNTTNTPCAVFYTERNHTGIAPGASGALGSGASWSTATQIGTMRASCSVANLADRMRPSLAINRRTSPYAAYVAWYNFDANKIQISSNESGSWLTEDAVTGLTSGNAGYPSIAIDPNARSYIVYYDGGGAYMVTNNARAGAATSGGWSSGSTIQSTGVTGVSTIGISGMQGRSRNTTGQ